MSWPSSLLGLCTVFAAGICQAAVIDQVTGVSFNPSFTSVTGIGPGEANATTSPFPITVTAAISDINRNTPPSNRAQITYRVGSSIPVPPGGTPNPGIANYSVTITNNDPSVDPADFFRDFVIRIPSNYVPGVAITAATASPASFAVTSLSTSEVIWRSNPGVGAGSYTFGFDLSIPNPTTGNTFAMNLVARNPEPGSMALAAVAMTVLGGGAARRRHKKKIKDQAEPEALAV